MTKTEKIFIWFSILATLIQGGWIISKDIEAKESSIKWEQYLDVRIDEINAKLDPLQIRVIDSVKIYN